LALGHKCFMLKIVSYFIPYIAVLVGLYVFGSGWLAMLGYHFGMAVVLVCCHSRGLFGEIFKGWNLLALLGGGVLSALVFPVLYFLWPYMETEGGELGGLLSKYGLCGISWVLFMVYFSTVQPLLEELFWRGYHVSSKRSVCMADVAFAGYHILVLALFIKWGWLAVAFFVLVCVSWLWRYLARRFGGLLAPVVSHVVADVCIVWVVWVLSF
jgi:membrane protease YdiL (CAAX protease family)